MPANNRSKIRLKELLSKALYYISVFGEETRANLERNFKGIKTYQIKEEKQNVAIKSFDLKTKENLETYTLKPIYVLIKQLKKDLKPPESNINKINPNITLPISIKEYINLNFHTVIKKFKPKTCEIIIKEAEKLIFDPKVLFYKKISFDPSVIGEIKPDEFSKPQVVEELIKIKPIIKQRSDSFKTNLPIEKKSIKLLNFSNNELDFFKEKLTERCKVHKNRIKILSIYDKLNIRNIQNLKIDAQTKNLYFTFKPQKDLTKDSTCCFLVIGLNRKNNASVSTTVSEIEFRSFQNN